MFNLCFYKGYDNDFTYYLKRSAFQYTFTHTHPWWSAHTPSCDRNGVTFGWLPHAPYPQCLPGYRIGLSFQLDPNIHVLLTFDDCIRDPQYCDLCGHRIPLVNNVMLQIFHHISPNPRLMLILIAKIWFKRFRYFHFKTIITIPRCLSIYNKIWKIVIMCLLHFLDPQILKSITPTINYLQKNSRVFVMRA